MRHTFYILFALVAVCGTHGCITEFEPPYTAGYENILVVEGLISEGETIIRLSESVALNGAIVPTSESGSGARVWVEGEGGERFESTGRNTAGGVVIPVERLDDNTRYRLRISHAGREYESEWRLPQSTPGIDELDFHHPGGESPIQVRIDVTGEAGLSGYYMWEYDETWEIRAEQQAYIYFGTHEGDYTGYSYGEYLASLKGTPLTAYYYSGISPFFYCWKYGSNRQILVARTEQLSENSIRNHVLFEIGIRGIDDDRLSTLYRLNVKQYCIARDAFHYFDNLKKNTDEAGSIFAPIPSEMAGNIVCTSSPETQVIGFVEVSRRAERETYINTGDTPYINPPYKGTATVGSWSAGEAWMYYPISPETYAYKECIDCRAMHGNKIPGGTKTRPERWPNDHY